MQQPAHRFALLQVADTDLLEQQAWSLVAASSVAEQELEQIDAVVHRKGKVKENARDLRENERFHFQWKKNVPQVLPR